MDSIFFLEDGDRSLFLLKIMESFGCTYICLWQYFQPSNTFICLGGMYNGENDVAQRLFEEYKHSWLIMDNGRIPGMAFKNNLPYMEFQFADLQSHASNPVQLQFYQEAGIKTTICMGCSIGEIEFGMISSPRMNLEMEMKNLFPECFSSPAAPGAAAIPELPHHQPILLSIDQNKPSSSSSFSLDSPGEHSSLLFNVASTQMDAAFPQQQTIRPVSATTIQTPTSRPQIPGSIQFRRLETEDAALTRAYLAVMTSPSSSSSSHQSTDHYQKASAFRRFIRSSFGPPKNVQIAASRSNMLRRSITFFRNLNMMRRQEQIQAANLSASSQRAAPTSTQVHHMISERRRREKLNDSFQLLRSLLPPGTKKDKASVLASTTKYLSSLKAQVEELSKKNEMLEAQLVDLPQMKSDGNERVAVEIIDIGGESTSESRLVNLQVSVREDDHQCNILDLVTRLLQFLKTCKNLTLISLAASTRHITLRIRIEGSEWDKSAFEEAVRRVVGD